MGTAVAQLPQPFWKIMEKEIEVFKSIKGYEGYYEVSNFGRVKSLPKRWSVGVKGETFLKTGKRTVKKLTYLFVVLCVDRVKKYASVHRLVAIHFCDNPNGYNVVNHLDSNTRNNYYKNLEWTTSSGNSIHGFKFGNRKGMIGAANPNTKISKEQVLQIKELCKMGEISQKTIAEMFGIRQAQVSRINTNKRWNYI